MNLVGTPCMTFLSILTQVSFKGQFWLSFDDTDFLCPHPNISFEAKNHPKNLPKQLFRSFLPSLWFFAGDTKKKSFFSWLLIGFPLFSALVTLTKESCPPPIVSSDTLSFSCSQIGKNSFIRMMLSSQFYLFNFSCSVTQVSKA